jgi:hypothetical protein
MAEEDKIQQPEQVEKKFTQAEVDHIVKERLAREREKYTDYDSLKQSAEKLKGIEDANKSEAEKQAAKALDYEKKLQEAESRREAAEKQAAAERRIRQVIALATTAGAIDPQDANILAATDGIDPAAGDAETQIKNAVEAVKKNKPYLFRQGNQVSSFNPATGSGINETDAERVRRLTQTAGYSKTPLG